MHNPNSFNYNSEESSRATNQARGNKIYNVDELLKRREALLKRKTEIEARLRVLRSQSQNNSESTEATHLPDLNEDFNDTPESTSKGRKLLFPRIHQALPTNPTERDKFTERVHCDLDLDTIREMLFVKDQIRTDTYDLANGGLSGILADEGEDWWGFEEEVKNGANMEDAFRILRKSNFLPLEKWERSPNKDEPEENMLKHVFQANLSTTMAFFSDQSKYDSREEGRARATKNINILNKAIREGKFNFLDMDDRRDIKYKLASDDIRYFGGAVGRFWDQDGGFFHLYSPFHRGSKAECRLYLCPKNLNSMIDHLVNEQYETGVMSWYMKYDDFARNDRLVIYTDFDHINQELEVINNVYEKHPELFRDMGENPLWGSIDGAPKGVYFGEEPKSGSYGSVRGDAFDDAFEHWLSSYGMESKKKGVMFPGNSHQVNFHNLNDITDDMVYHFIDFFKQELLKHKIDPSNPCFNK